MPDALVTKNEETTGLQATSEEETRQEQERRCVCDNCGEACSAVREDSTLVYGSKLSERGERMFRWGIDCSCGNRRQIGVACPATGKSLTQSDVLKGMTVIVPTPFGTFAAVVDSVNELEAEATYASGKMAFHLVCDNDLKRWRCDTIGNPEAIKRCSFT